MYPERKFTGTLLLDDGIVEEIKEPVYTDLLVIGIEVDSAELFCDLDELPFEERGVLEGKAEDSRHSRGSRSIRKSFTSARPRMIRETEEKHGRRQIPTVVPSRADMRIARTRPRRLVRLVPGTDIADYAFVSVFERDQLVGRDRDRFLSISVRNFTA